MLFIYINFCYVSVTIERSEEVWLEKQRAEREEEFAPPSFYYDTSSYSKYNIKKDNKIKGNNPKDKKLLGKDREEIEVKEVIEKQLSKIRNSSDLECSKAENTNVVSNKELVMTHKSNNAEKDTILDSVKTEDLPQKAVDPLHTTNIPSPNFNVPPPSYMAPPPNYSAPPPNFMAPPPNYTVPPTNYSVPPPNHSVPPPSFNVPPPTAHFPASNVPHPGHIQLPVASSLPVPSAPQNVSVKENPVPSFENNLSATTSFENSSQGGQYVDKQAEEKVRKKFVPKIDIIDTRLMGGEGD